MIAAFTQPEAARSALGGVCRVIACEQKPGRGRLGTDARVGARRFPHRPDPGVISEAIPLFFIGRSPGRLWIARDAEGRKGGVFLFKASALRYAARYSAPAGCAIMFLSGRCDLDVANEGGWLAGVLEILLRTAADLVPGYRGRVILARAGRED